MAQPLSSDRFLAALRAEGVTVAEVGNWREHNRNHKGAWGPVHGLVIHHTVSSGTASSVALCRDGYDELPGPLCHGVIAKDGTVHLVGYGRTNHAGGGDPAVLEHVIAEDYGHRPPPPTRGNLDGVDGNRAFYGFECINRGDGRDPWPTAQLDAIERVSAALCRAHGWSAKSVIGHLEWSNDKSDPRGFTMPDMRARIARRLSGQPGHPSPNPTEDTVPYPLGEASTTRVDLRPDTWTTVRIGRDNLISGARSYTAAVYLRVDALPGGVLQGRFVHQRPDGSRWTSPIVERIATTGSSFVDFLHAGSILPGETLRFEITYGPATAGDTAPATLTAAQARGLYWK
ncbi:peptidoglycan recognition family protein [Streptomyces sp. AV19]|uniref:peptidoglycan recognition protein family protein n=2 Tax=Streptomyces sp. AV19 TaxID=2793068 RepID=UPI0024132DAC|nr:peptidoglycan recognition family protein [Streptomyces sp. AV19]MDG4531599.1 N-acetylmuramoyl-L-alanine amidase [Streptomyces sp. AV19]